MPCDVANTMMKWTNPQRDSYIYEYAMYVRINIRRFPGMCGVFKNRFPSITEIYIENNTVSILFLEYIWQFILRLKILQWLRLVEKIYENLLMTLMVFKPILDTRG